MRQHHSKLWCMSLGALLLSTLPAAVTPSPIKCTKIGGRLSCRLLARPFNSAVHMMAASTSQSSDPLQGLPQPLILGSASFTRKLILREMGINFAIVVRPIDEGAIGSRETDTPAELVRTLSQAKMDHLVSEIEAGRCDDDLPARTDGKQDWIILTADQVVTCHGKILEKPVDVNQAKQFVAQYGRYPCSTVGHVVLTHWPSRISVSGLHVATIHFSPTLIETAASRLVDELLNENAPILSCAGGLMVEHPLTRQYIERIEGSEDSVMGLDKQTVTNLLDQLRLQLAHSTVQPKGDSITAPE
jgi:septum formation protein